ncbi:MAG: nitrate reductase molybdenum cofactor assembly chaperone [Desulfobacterales bacterium]|nr:nitrate reductase molybdenum cofactor assembly chaperone [Desulfobacterales bacterium]
MVPLSADALRLLSVLLHYPDDDLLGHLDEIAAAAGLVPEEDIQTAAEGFLSYLGAHPPIRLQENFTAAFDMRPETTLNLTYHAFGDNEKRAAALARLQHVYDQAGWERTTGELPDYLPLMLEFLSIQPRPESVLPVWQCLRATAALAAGLEKTAPVYAALLRPLAGAATAVCPDDGRVPGQD